MAGAVPVVLADGVIEAQVARGVARIALGRAAGEGEAERVAVLAVPVSRLAVVTRGLAVLLGEMEKRVKASSGSIVPPNAEQGSAETAVLMPQTRVSPRAASNGKS